MMRLAPTRGAIEPATVSGGLLLRMRAWFAGSATACAPALGEPQDDVRHDDLPVAAPAGRARTATLLPFPIHGEALLVRLAEQLRNNVANRVPEHDPLLLGVSRRRPCSCLTIDRSAYVDFDASSASYRVVIATAPDTTITAETTDFDIVVKFVAQYVGNRLSDGVIAETAS
jgi:hypothetical protein